MHNILESLKSLSDQQRSAIPAFSPVFFNLSAEDDRRKVEALLATPGLQVKDEIRSQIGELIKLRYAFRKFSTDDLKTETNNFLKDTDPLEYGIWVYYPWSHRLVHILDEKEFVEVRTSRNTYKISPAERDQLAKKKIGVIGLSVGQSVSVTLAMERICSEIRLADFDLLELTNLNRIRTGVHNLGLPKVYSVAREIAEIDPFIKVVCFPEGLNRDNMDLFFTGGGKLDLLVEESDGFDIKILCRHKARELRVPVVMEGSDRCLVDVERFDLEPERDILHGLVNHLDVNMLSTLKTNEEKIPYMLDVLGLDDSSRRLKASMLEIEQTITTWPQLASAVTMGGGITADVSRRILLDQFRASGRYHVDIEELIGDNPKPGSQTPRTHVSQVTISDYCKRVSVTGGKNSLVNSLTARQLAEAGCLAPSGGNWQPWRWIFGGGNLHVFNAHHGAEAFLGHRGLASFVAIGAGIQNVLLRASALGLSSNISWEGEGDKVAVIEFSKASAKADPLSEYINKRATNRLLSGRERIEKNVLDQLCAAAGNDASLSFISEDDELAQAAVILGELDQIRLMEEWGHEDFVAEIRWTEEENQATRDGIDLQTLDLTNSEKVGLQVARDPQVMSLVREWGGGGAFRKLTRKSIDAAGAVGVLSIPKKGRLEWLRGGMALQRIWLTATRLGIGFQPMAASVFMYARANDIAAEGFSSDGRKKMAALRERYEQVMKIPATQQELFIFRLAKNGEPKVKSLRKPLEEMYIYCE